jgi:hypothetical protein
MTRLAGPLREAFSNIHRDPRWWRSVLLGGLCMLSGVLWPMAAGLVVESLDNTRKGYPTPLPPWIDLGTRYLIGLFALLIDFVLFVLPVFVGIALLVCIMLATLVVGGGAGGNTFTIVGNTLASLLLLIELCVFLSSASPVGRLLYVEEGRIEDALGMRPLRRALAVPARGFYARARLTSLLAYLPFALLVLIALGVAQIAFPGRFLALILLAWLALSALFYAHLAVAQLYALAEKEVQLLSMQAHMR